MTDALASFLIKATPARWCAQTVGEYNTLALVWSPQSAYFLNLVDTLGDSDATRTPVKKGQKACLPYSFEGLAPGSPSPKEYGSNIPRVDRSSKEGNT